MSEFVKGSFWRMCGHLSFTDERVTFDSLIAPQYLFKFIYWVKRYNFYNRSFANIKVIMLEWRMCGHLIGCCISRKWGS